MPKMTSYQKARLRTVLTELIDEIMHWPWKYKGRRAVLVTTFVEKIDNIYEQPEHPELMSLRAAPICPPNFPCGVCTACHVAGDGM